MVPGLMEPSSATTPGGTALEAERFVICGATPADKDYVCDRLADTFPATPRDQWEHLFDYPWRDAAQDCGVALELGGRVVGFLGCIHSHRVVDGTRHDVANMIGWWVDPTLRGDGLGRRVADAWMTRYADRTATMLTFRYDHMAFWSRYGIRQFETDRRAYVLRPWWLLHGALPEVPASHVTPDLVGIEPYRRYRDHLGLRCRSEVLLLDGEAVVLISRRRDTELPTPAWLAHLRARHAFVDRLFAPRSGMHGLRLQLQRLLDVTAGRLPMAEVLYVSQPALMARFLPRITAHLARRHRAAGVLASASRIGDPSVAGRHVPSHYWERTLVPNAPTPDALYCEFLLMAM